MSSSSLIARVRTSAVRRKANGDSGHPWGTPLATLNEWEASASVGFDVPDRFSLGVREGFRVPSEVLPES
eukprot:scaffold174638_cov25-Tisochrysis_lutea.AAC.1